MVLNRTMDGELLRPALIPWVSVMWDVDGFLHWGYNRWQRNQGQDPFKDPYPKRCGGPNNGNSLPPGDTHIVYPGKDGPWPSARLEATRAGMEDADLLTMLRRPMRSFAASRAGSMTTRRRASSTAKSAATSSGPCRTRRSGGRGATALPVLQGGYSITTLVPMSQSSRRRTAFQLERRKQPCDSARPICSGQGVPWMP